MKFLAPIVIILALFIGAEARLRGVTPRQLQTETTTETETSGSGHGARHLSSSSSSLDLDDILDGIFPDGDEGEDEDEDEDENENDWRDSFPWWGSEPTPGPTPGPTPVPTPGPTPVPTPGPTHEPTPEPTPGPTPGPTLGPTPAPIPLECNCFSAEILAEDSTLACDGKSQYEGREIKKEVIRVELQNGNYFKWVMHFDEYNNDTCESSFDGKTVEDSGIHRSKSDTCWRQLISKCQEQ